MSLFKTFAEIKTDRGILKAAGVCHDSEEFRQYVNKACDLAVQRGDWTGTEMPMHLCVRSGCVVFPRFVAAIRKLNSCRQRHILTNNFLWDFVDGGTYRSWCGAPFNTRQMTNMGFSPVYQDIPNGDWLVRAYITKQADIGKYVTLFGADGNGQSFTYKNAAGQWVDGTRIRLENPFGTTRPSGPPLYVRNISRVLKDATQGNVPLYAYKPSDGTLIQIADYGPTETNPQYSKYRLDAGCCGTGENTSCNNGVFSVVALVKLKFVPVESDTDIVLIPSTMALQQIIQSIKFSEAGNTGESVAYMAMGVRELSHVLDNYTPPEDMPVDPSFRGHECVGFSGIF